MPGAFSLHANHLANHLANNLANLAPAKFGWANFLANHLANRLSPKLMCLLLTTYRKWLARVSGTYAKSHKSS